MQKINLIEIGNKLNKIDIGSEPVIFLHSSLFHLGRIDFRVSDLLSIIIDWLGPDGTLVMPSFSYHNNTTDPWFAKRTIGKTGLLTECFRLQQGALRSIHPIHSITAFGKLSHYLTREVDATSFGEKSSFSKLIEMDALNIALGIGFVGGATFLHYSEQKLEVPYREFVKLGVTAYDLYDQKLSEDFLYFGRKRNQAGKDLYINDWGQSFFDLNNEGFFNYDKIGSSNIMWSRMGSVSKYMSNKIMINPYYCAKKLFI